MKQIIIFLFSMLASFQTVTAQDRSVMELKTDTIAAKVIQYLRDHQPDSIYLLAGEKFKGKVTLENFRNIAENQLFPLNDFRTVSFVKSTNGLHYYKIKGNPDLQLLIKLDPAFRIETLLIQPYKQE